MKWVKTKGHISEAVTHFNHAIEDLKIGRSVVEVSRCLFDAMNKIQTEWVISENNSEMGEIKALKSMILKGLDTEDHINYLQSAEIRNFVFFEPRPAVARPIVHKAVTNMG